MLMPHQTVREIPIAQPTINHPPRLHVAIISDGNGRWATSKGLPRSAGHRAGAETARRIIETAPRLGIQTLTLFVLSKGFSGCFTNTFLPKRRTALTKVCG